MDALSDVLKTVRLRGAIFFDIRASEPWVAETPPAAAIVSRIFPGAEHLISYHAVTQGSCWAALDGEAPVQLSDGDIIVFPHGESHVLSSAPGMRGTPDRTLYRQATETQLPFTIKMGETGATPTQIVCGFLACDAQPFNPLLTALPRFIRVGDRTGGALAAFVGFAVAESKEPRVGGEAVLARLSELMFLDVVRRYLETLPPDRTDWLSALRDPVVGRALMALHGRPADEWTIESLGREVGLSRSVLADRFTQFVGEPPMQYLKNWRMQLAASRLTSGTDTIAAIAERVGYASEAAFSRAFKKVAGVSPSEWRKRRDGSGQA